MTAKDACKEVADAGGIAALTSGARPLGLSPRVLRHVTNDATISREYKRAKQDTSPIRHSLRDGKIY
jgi:hypothetical protein